MNKFCFFFIITLGSCELKQALNSMEGDPVSSSNEICIKEPCEDANNPEYEFFKPDEAYLRQLLLLWPDTPLNNLQEYCKEVKYLAKCGHFVFVGVEFSGVGDNVCQSCSYSKIVGRGEEGNLTGQSRDPYNVTYEVFYTAKDIRGLLKKYAELPSKIDFINPKNLSIIGHDKEEAIELCRISIFFRFARIYLGDFVGGLENIKQEIYNEEKDPLLEKFFLTGKSLQGEEAAWIQKTASLNLYLVVVSFLRYINLETNRPPKEIISQIIALYLSYAHFSKLPFIDNFKRKIRNHIDEMLEQIKLSPPWLLEAKKSNDMLLGEIKAWQELFSQDSEAFSGNNLEEEIKKFVDGMLFLSGLMNLLDGLLAAYEGREGVWVDGQKFRLVLPLSIGRFPSTALKNESIFCNNYRILFELFEKYEILALNSLMHIFHGGNPKTQIMELYCIFKFAYSELLNGQEQVESALPTTYRDLRKAMEKFIFPKPNKKPNKKSEKQKKEERENLLSKVNEPLARHIEVIEGLVPNNENIKMLMSLLPLVNFTEELFSGKQNLSDKALRELSKRYLQELGLLNMPTVYAYLCYPVFPKYYSSIDPVLYLREVLSAELDAFKYLKEIYEQEAISSLFRELVHLKSQNLLTYNKEEIKKICHLYLGEGTNFELEYGDEESKLVPLKGSSEREESLCKSLSEFLLKPIKSNVGKREFQYLPEHTKEEYASLRQIAVSTYEKYVNNKKFFYDLFVRKLRVPGSEHEFFLYFSIRSGIFFIPLPPEIAMSDIDFTDGEKANRKEVIEGLVKEINNYSKENGLSTYTTSTANGMHVYIVDANKYSQDQLLDHLIALRCDESYLCTVFGQEWELERSLRVSEKLFKKNLWGSGYSSSLKSRDDLDKMHPEKMLAKNDKNQSILYENYFRSLKTIIDKLDSCFVKKLFEDKQLMDAIIWFKENSKRFRSQDELEYYAQNFVLYLRQLVENGFGEAPLR